MPKCASPTAPPTEERAFMADEAQRISTIYDFRSMVVTPGDQALTQVKAVDDAGRCTGSAGSRPGDSPGPGAVPAGRPAGRDHGPVLIDRLGLRIGDSFRLGTQEFRLAAALIREPDSASAGLHASARAPWSGPRSGRFGLLAPGTLYETKYRLRCPPAPICKRCRTRPMARFRDKGMRWTDSRNAAPGIERFVDRIGSFLVLVGLAGLAVGGVGISAAVRSLAVGKDPQPSPR
jgi:putative ABC transport system permease protein